jgi:hypothetical protein
MKSNVVLRKWGDPAFSAGLTGHYHCCLGHAQDHMTRLFNYHKESDSGGDKCYASF